PVATRVVEEFFGVPGPDLATLMRWMRAMFWEIFLDQLDLPGVRARAEQAATEMSAYLDGLIAERRRAPGSDYLSRLVGLQADPAPRLDDDAIKRNIGGIIVGAVDTTSKAASHALAWLIDHPEHLRTARQAALADDRNLVERVLFEALRFNPQAPL